MKIELKIDGNPIQDFELDEPTTIQDIMKSVSGLTCPVLSYKINYNLYVNDDYLLEQSALVEGITIKHNDGLRIYQDSTMFILAKAMYSLFGSGHDLVAEHSISDGVYCEVFDIGTFSEADCQRLTAEMQRIIAKEQPIEKIEVRFDEAEEIFSAMGRSDLLKNLQYYTDRKLHIYKCGKFYDFYLRPLVTNTRFIHEFELVYNAPGFVLRFPNPKDCKLSQPFNISAQLFKLHQEQDKWLNI